MDPECSKAAVARPKALELPAQQPAVISSKSHGDDDEMAKVPDSTPQPKEIADDASTKKALLDPQDLAKTTNIGSNLEPK